MSDLYFLDTNILMYAVGSEHPFKKPSLEILKKISEGEIMAVTDTEVFQEIAYRYWAQRKWSVAIQVLKDYEHLFSEIYPIEKQQLATYYRLLSDFKELSPRDAIHIAVMHTHQIRNICTTDKVFEKIPTLRVCFPT